MSDYLFRRQSTNTAPWAWAFPRLPDFYGGAGATGEEALFRQRELLPAEARPPQRAPAAAYEGYISHRPLEENMPPGRGIQTDVAPAARRTAVTAYFAEVARHALEENMPPGTGTQPDRARTPAPADRTAYRLELARHALEENLPPGLGTQPDRAPRAPGNSASWLFDFRRTVDFYAPPPGTGEEVLPRRLLPDRAPGQPRAASYAYEASVSRFVVSEPVPLAPSFGHATLIRSGSRSAAFTSQARAGLTRGGCGTSDLFGGPSR